MSETGPATTAADDDKSVDDESVAPAESAGPAASPEAATGPRPPAGRGGFATTHSPAPPAACFSSGFP